MRVALIHYWLVSWRGGERVLKALAEMFPEADIFTHVADPELVARHFPHRNIRTTFINGLPFARKLYQRYLPLMPTALENLDLQDYDLVISSESGPAKGVIVGPQAVHVCYCHSPMRYVWDRSADYLRHHGVFSRMMITPLLHYIRNWDQLSAQRVDHYVANSQFVARRIQKYYRCNATVIHPPVDVGSFAAAATEEDFYLYVGQLVPYKRADLLVDSFNELGRRLVIIGTGELLAALRKRAKPNIQLLGWQSSERIADYYRRCRALLFPGIEDFGIVPVEAMASGKPIIALGAGGALETVVDGVTGVLFDRPEVECIKGAVERFESQAGTFSAAAIRAHSLQFDTSVFKARFGTFVDSVLAARGK